MLNSFNESKLVLNQAFVVSFFKRREVDRSAHSLRSGEVMFVVHIFHSAFELAFLGKPSQRTKAPERWNLALKTWAS